MKKYLIVIFLIGFAIPAKSQKYRLVGDTDRFVCKSDSIEFYFKQDYFERNKVDTILEIHYLYDNGRYEDEIQAYIWKNNGKTKIKIITGCDDAQELEIREIEDQGHFEKYFDNRFDTTEHVLYSGASHDYGYSFQIKQGEFVKSGYIRDYIRGIDNFRSREEENNEVELKQDAEKNPLVEWINRIDEQILGEIKKE